MWITWRLTLMLYHKSKATLNGEEDRLTQLQYDWQYEDWFRDVEDGRYVNFRYGDHRDRWQNMSHFSHMMFKPGADKTKQALRFYKHGNDNFWDRLTKF
jgi:hypothetical protein